MPLDDESRRELVRELAARPGGTWVTCAGRSMEPTVKLGDRVRVRACRDVRAGDVVLFETADGRDHVLHRVVFKVPGLPFFLHIGDGGSGDGPGLVHLERLVGRADLPRRRPDLRTLAAGARRTVRAAIRVIRPR